MQVQLNGWIRIFYYGWCSVSMMLMVTTTTIATTTTNTDLSHSTDSSVQLPHTPHPLLQSTRFTMDPASNSTTLQAPQYSYYTYSTIIKYYEIGVSVILTFFLWHISNSFIILVTNAVFGFEHVIGWTKENESGDEDETDHGKFNATTKSPSSISSPSIILPSEQNNLNESLLNEEEKELAAQSEDLPSEKDLGTDIELSIRSSASYVSNACSLDTTDPELVLKPLDSLVWIMNHQIDLSAEVIRGSRCDKIFPGFIVTIVHHFLSGMPFKCLYKCTEGPLFIGHVVSSACWIRRFLKIILLGCLWATFIFFFEQTILYVQSIDFEQDGTVLQPLKCPTDITNNGQADCFHGTSGTYIPCHGPDATVPVNIGSMICYQFHPFTMIGLLTGVSSTAGFFSILLGSLVLGVSMVLSALPRRYLKPLRYIPIALIVVWGPLSIYLAHFGLTGLGFLLPYVLCGIVYFLIKIRMLIDDVKDKEEKEGIVIETIDA